MRFQPPECRLREVACRSKGADWIHRRLTPAGGDAPQRAAACRVIEPPRLYPTSPVQRGERSAVPQATAASRSSVSAAW